MINLKTLITPVLAGAAFLVAPVAAEALTIRLTDNVNGGGTITIADDGLGGDTTAGDGTVNFNGAFGGFALTVASGAAEGFPPYDTLFGNLLGALLSGVTSGDLTLEVSHVFDNSGTTPGDQGYSLTQDLNVLTGAGSVHSYYNVGSNLFGTDSLLNSVADSGTAGSTMSGGTVNMDSYTITHVINLTTTSVSGSVQGSATYIAPVPVPAAGLMLLTALGGLGIARRRKAA